ncbi:MAG TPA: hypothetical protein ENJ50_00560, partial [Planctomycetaceae bacterium]|nr:hypothetical protein [Planctomycetaceae bacterium]
MSMTTRPLTRIAALRVVLPLLLLTGTSPLWAGDVESVIFVRIPNKPDGRPGIYYEPFMYHFGRSAHVPGSQLVKLSPPRPDGKLTVLSKDFFAVEEPELSWDGKKILFAGKKTRQDGWEVWEMNVDG